MGKEDIEGEINQQGEISQPVETMAEDRYGWGDYFQNLSQQISEFGEPSEEGKKALREFFEGRKKIEQQWYQGEIDAKERNNMKFRLARKFSEEYSNLFEDDKAFSEAVGIIRDETG